MFRFANPYFLYMLLLLPVFVAAYWYFCRKRKQNISVFGDAELLKNLMPDLSWMRRHLKFGLLMMAFTLLVFILARPQFGTRTEEVKRNGIEVIIAVDVSNSMLCEDVQPSRLQKAKMIVSKLIDQLDEDRVGLIAFAGNAITLLPVTQDGVSAKMFLEQLSTQTVSVQGTNMSDAIRRALAGFSSSEQKDVGRALVFITDAEDNEEGALEAAKDASSAGVNIFVLSVGTEDGGPIPLGGGKYKLDNSGNTVITHLNEDIGKEIAEAGNGVYMHVDQTDAAQAMLDAEISKMQKQDMMSSMYSDFDEQFVAVAILLLIVLIAEICVSEKRQKGLALLKKIRGLRAVFVLVLLLSSVICHLSSVNAQTPNDNVRIGNYFYRQKKYDKAETYYRKALEKKQSLETLYNLGNAQVMQGQDSLAYQSYKQALACKSDNKLKRSHICHNMGNIMYAAGMADYKEKRPEANQMFGQAVEDYKSSLRLNPNDDKARYNLALAQYMYKKTKNDKNQQNQQNKNNKDNKDNKDQNKDKDKDKNKDQNKDKNKNDDKDQDQNQDQNQNKDDNQNNNQQQQKKSDMDEKTAQQLLNAAQQDEKRVQKKLIKQQTQRRSYEKDW